MTKNTEIILLLSGKFPKRHSAYIYNTGIERDETAVRPSPAALGSARRCSALGSRSYTARTEVSHGQSSRTPRSGRSHVASCHCRRTSMRSGKRFSQPVISRELSDRYCDFKRCSKTLRECVDLFSVQ